MHEIIQVPSVVLTERAFEWARSEGILDVQPNHDLMLAIGQITNTGTEYLPDITVLRHHVPLGQWDVNYDSAPPELPYIPSRELSVTERGLQFVSAGNLRRHIHDTGKTLLQLTVQDWDKLGEALAEEIEMSKTRGKEHPKQGSDLIVGALGEAASRLFGNKPITPRQKRIDQAGSLQPYTIKRQRQS